MTPRFVNIKGPIVGGIKSEPFVPTFTALDFAEVEQRCLAALGSTPPPLAPDHLRHLMRRATRTRRVLVPLLHDFHGISAAKPPIPKPPFFPSKWADRFEVDVDRFLADVDYAKYTHNPPHTSVTGRYKHPVPLFGFHDLTGPHDKLQKLAEKRLEWAKTVKIDDAALYGSSMLDGALISQVQAKLLLEEFNKSYGKVFVAWDSCAGLDKLAKKSNEPVLIDSEEKLFEHFGKPALDVPAAFGPLFSPLTTWLMAPTPNGVVIYDGCDGIPGGVKKKVKRLRDLFPNRKGIEEG